jgi:hypothetical protein
MILIQNFLGELRVIMKFVSPDSWCPNQDFKTGPSPESRTGVEKTREEKAIGVRQTAYGLLSPPAGDRISVWPLSYG